MAVAHGDEAAGRVATVVLVLLALFSLVVGGVYLLLAVLDNKGLRAARVITWILAGLTITVTAIALLVGGNAAVPWYGAMTTTLTSATLLLAIAATILLGLPAASQFYRARKPPRPPAPGPIHLAYPVSPPNPMRPPAYPGPSSFPPPRPPSHPGPPGFPPPEPPSHPGPSSFAPPGPPSHPGPSSFAPPAPPSQPPASSS
jgi:hypothetical protein